MSAAALPADGRAPSLQDPIELPSRKEQRRWSQASVDTEALERIRGRRVLEVARAGRVVAACVLTLMAIGLVAIDGSTMAAAEGAQRLIDAPLGRQLVWSAVALLALMIGADIDYRRYKAVAIPLYVLTIILLVVVLIPGVGTGMSQYGARRWIRIGGMGIQPSEIAKLSLVIGLAAYLHYRGDQLHSFLRGTLPALSLVGLMAGLVLVEPDFGSALFLGGVAMLVLFAAGMRMGHVLPMVMLAAMPVAHLVVTRMDHVKARIGTFLDPAADPHGKGHQILQSLIALGSGGLTGRGLGMGRQKMYFLPEAKNDFIFAHIGEELGWIGCVLIIALFAMLVWYGIKIALCAPTDFGTYLALGIVLVIGLQACANIAVVTASVPTKGIGLPFVSYGGSSLVIFCAMAGILLNIARQAMDPEVC